MKARALRASVQNHNCHVRKGCRCAPGRGRERAIGETPSTPRCTMSPVVTVARWAEARCEREEHLQLLLLLLLLLRGRCCFNWLQLQRLHSLPCPSPLPVPRPVGAQAADMEGG
ncbi:hypothetical protein PLESTM_000776200 [Pleodorina starrii]|nr:hypothetical protein PLESTM_000776200 [Pleodorina starrii]